MASVEELMISSLVECRLTGTMKSIKPMENSRRYALNLSLLQGRLADACHYMITSSHIHTDLYLCT